MKYRCDKEDCKRTFTHPQKLIEHRANELLMHAGVKVLPTAEDWVEVETYTCPFCNSQSFSEFVEAEEDIASVKSVPIEEADSWIAQGYQVSYHPENFEKPVEDETED